MQGRGRGERRPPPGTPGVSSGVQVKLLEACMGGLDPLKYPKGSMP